MLFCPPGGPSSPHAGPASQPGPGGSLTGAHKRLWAQVQLLCAAPQGVLQTQVTAGPSTSSQDVAGEPLWGRPIRHPAHGCPRGAGQPPDTRGAAVGTSFPALRVEEVWRPGCGLPPSPIGRGPAVSQPGYKPEPVLVVTLEPPSPVRRACSTRLSAGLARPSGPRRRCRRASRCLEGCCRPGRVEAVLRTPVAGGRGAGSLGLRLDGRPPPTVSPPPTWGGHLLPFCLLSPISFPAPARGQRRDSGPVTREGGPDGVDVPRWPCRDCTAPRAHGAGCGWGDRPSPHGPFRPAGADRLGPDMECRASAGSTEEARASLSRCCDGQ